MSTRCYTGVLVACSTFLLPSVQRLALGLAIAASAALAACAGGGSSGSIAPPAAQAGAPGSGSAVTLSRNATATPSATSSPATASTYTVLIYQGVASSTEWYYQGGAGSCPNNPVYVPGVFTSTPEVVGTLSPGKLVTVYATLYDWQNNVLPSGSCPDHMTNTTEVVVGGATPTPAPLGAAKASPAASPSPTTAPTPLSTPPPSSSASAANYTQVVNAREWPTTYRVGCANTVPTPGAPCPYSVVLPTSPSHLMTQNGGSAAILTAMASHSALGVGIMNGEGFTSSGVYATYLAASTDPAVSVTCTGSCWNGSSVVASYSTTIPHVPSYARTLSGTCPGDCQMDIIEPDGTNYSIYGMSTNYSGGSSMTVGGLAETNIVTGNAVDPCYASLAYPGAGGACTNNGTTVLGLETFRVDEIQNGVIPHALVVVTNQCTSGQVYPGSDGFECSTNYGYTGPPNGARLIVNLTDAQINGTQSNSLGYNASNTAAWERVLLHQLRDYGIILSATCANGCGDAAFLIPTQYTQITSAGGTPPTQSFNWASPASGSGGIGTFPHPWKPGALDLTQAASWLILDPCYSLESCSDSVN